MSDALATTLAGPAPEEEGLAKRLLRRQWPFWLGGLFVGLAEIVFYFHTDMFIVVTTGMAQMFAVSEETLFGIDWVARVYEPGVHWTIVAALLGARLVAGMEGESRSWVKYNWKMLVLAFIGGLLFSFGTRLAAGCTTHHFIGGIPAMSIASWVVLLSGIPFAFIAFLIAMKAGLGGYFKHQETKATAIAHQHDTLNPQPAYDASYNPWLSPLRWALNAFLILFLALPIYFGITGWISGSVNQIGWSEVIWMMIPGLLLGIGIAKTGFGTECSVMAPEATFTKEAFYRKGGVPQCTYYMFRGMLPLQGFMVAIVSFNLFIMVWWLTGNGTVPNASGAAGLYWGHILGGPLLAMGAVFMIGCEVRTYARLGLGYSTALVALPGFYIGYLPYTLFQEQIDAVVFGEGLTDFITIPEWAAYTIGGTEVQWAVLYSLAMIGLLVMSFQAARVFLRVKLSETLSKNTDELVYRTRPEAAAA
jgi:uncharacterized membrane protein YedE/YeeE